MSAGPLPPQIGAGLGDYAVFRALLRALIPRVEIVRPDGVAFGRPLAALSTEAPADPTLALVDAVAALADIASFYQDRILNEGYLPHAVDPSSLALFARGLGQMPALFVGAAVDLALFAAPGPAVAVPAGAAVQAPLPRNAAAPPPPGTPPGAGRPSAAPLAVVFETAAPVVARPELNRRTALLTGPARLDPHGSELLLAGTGLGIAPGDPILLVRAPDAAGREAWMRLTAHTVVENAGLRATAVSVGGVLADLWTAAGNDGLPPAEAPELRLYALGLTCRLFGYNAGLWAAQPYAIRRLAVPAGQPVGAYDDWPGFSVDPEAFDLQALYARLVTGSRLVLELPTDRRLATVAATAREQVARFGLSGQATRVRLGPASIVPVPAPQPEGGAAPLPVDGPAFPCPLDVASLDAVWLADGTVLVVVAGTVALWDEGPDPFGGPFPPGPPMALAWVFDPATGRFAPTGAPIRARVGASLTLLSSGTVLVAGGVGLGPDPGAGTVLADAELYDPGSRAFCKVGKPMARPRWGHSATALADGTVLLAGGTGGAGAAEDGAELFEPSRLAFSPLAHVLPEPMALQTATLLPDGAVLLAGGVRTVESVEPTEAVPALDLAVLYDPTERVFIRLDRSIGARVGHTATLRPDGTVLIAGGSENLSPAPLATTAIYDPGGRTVEPGPPLTAPRWRHGATVWGAEVLVVGGAQSPSYEILGTEPSTATGPLDEPLPFSGEARLCTLASRLARRARPVAVGAAGIVAFGLAPALSGPDAPEAWNAAHALRGVLFPRGPRPPFSTARREAQVFAQSRPLALARPLDTGPVAGDRLALDGPAEGLVPGRPVLVSGLPPLARTTGPTPIVGGGAGPLAAGTLVAVAASLPCPHDGVAWWQVATPDAPRLTVETTAAGGLAFLAGTGAPPGDVSPAEAKAVARIPLCERAVIRTSAFDAAAGATCLTFAEPLAHLYDRTTLTLYGNVAAATEGRSVVGEVLGSGDGQVAFQSFTLKLAPLAMRPDRDAGYVPELTVRVDGIPWTRVAALSACGPQDRVYQLDLDVHGRARVQFGNGLRGQRLPTRNAAVTADYRVGAGAAGNVPAGSLTRAPARVAGIKGVLNPLPAIGGADAGTRAGLRAAIPEAARRTGRIVTQADILAFVRADPAVRAATLTTLDGRSLVTLAGPGNAVPDLDSDAFRALRAALRRVMAAPLPHRLLPVAPAFFKLAGRAAPAPGADAAAVAAAMTEAVLRACGPGALGFGQPVRAFDLAALLGRVPGVAGAVTITALWIPTRTGPGEAALLPARPAAGPPWRGAEILALSPDADAVGIALDGTAR